MASNNEIKKVLSKLPLQVTESFRDKTIVISGACGYIGSSLVQTLADLDCRLVLIDKSFDIDWESLGYKAKIKMINGDIVLRQTWESAFKAYPEVDYLFHLASLEYNRKKFDIVRDWEINAFSVANFHEVLIDNNLKPKIIFSSSANLFGSGEVLPINETVKSESTSLWSAHKLTAEQYISVYSKKYGFNSVILRLANVYGPTVNIESMNNVVINRMINDAIEGRPLKLFNNKNSIRDYIFIWDVINAFLYAASSKNVIGDGRYYLVGSSEAKPIEEVWKLIADRVLAVTGKSVPIEIDKTVKLEPLDMRNFVSDTSLFKKTGWQPNTFIDEGIDITVKSIISAKKINKENKKEEIKLNLGCGGRLLPGYINIDLDSLEVLKSRYPNEKIPDNIKVFHYDIFNLPFPDNSVSEVKCDALLEHLSFLEEPKFFYEVKRVLRKGGLFVFSVPDFEDTMQLFLKAKDEWKDFYRCDPEAINKNHWFGQYSYAMDNRWGYLTASIFGPQNVPGQFHKNCYTKGKIKAILKRLNFIEEEISTFCWKGNRDILMLLVKARKD